MPVGQQYFYLFQFTMSVGIFRFPSCGFSTEERSEIKFHKSMQYRDNVAHIAPIQKCPDALNSARKSLICTGCRSRIDYMTDAKVSTDLCDNNL